MRIIPHPWRKYIYNDLEIFIYCPDPGRLGNAMKCSCDWGYVSEKRHLVGTNPEENEKIQLNFIHCNNVKSYNDSVA